MLPITRTQRTDRLLRACAWLSLLVALAVGVLIVVGPNPTPLIDPGFYPGFTDSGMYWYFRIWLPLLAQGTFQFAVGVGVAALAATVWRRTYAWSVTLLLVLLLVSVVALVLGPYTGLFYQLFHGVLSYYQAELLAFYAGLPALLPLLTLVYSYTSTHAHSLAGPDLAVNLEGIPTSSPTSSLPPNDPESLGS